jgi:DNA repair protein SbcC/Rad50
MRPLKLVVSGFTCFKDIQTVDFANLELFAILGQTGAGKSSLLDAMTFALYGVTPRLGRNDVTALIAQGATGLMVSLEFEVGTQTFRASRIKSGAAKETQVRFERLEASGWVTAVEGVKIKDTSAAIEAVVGLDFKGFTRAILLPQGEFDRFLRGNASERRELLKGLTNLDQLEKMREMASERAKGFKAKSDAIKTLLEGEYAVATAEALELIESELLTLEADLKSAQVSLESNRTQLEEAREVTRIVQELERARTNLRALTAQAGDLEANRERAGAARRAANVLPRLEAFERSERALKLAESDLEKRIAARDLVQKNFDRAEELHDAAREAAEAIPKLEVRLNSLIEARERLKRLRALGGRLENAEEGFVWNEDRFSRLEGLRAQVPVLARFDADLNDLEREEKTSSERIRNLETDADKLTLQLEACKNEGIEAGKTANASKLARAAAEKDNRVAAALAGVQVGDPCPICGTTLKKLPDLEQNNLAEMVLAQEQAEANLRELRDEYARIKAELAATNTNLNRSRQEHERFAEKRTRLEHDRVNVLEVFAAELGATENVEAKLKQARGDLLAGLAFEVSNLTGGLDPEEAAREAQSEKKNLQTKLESARENWTNAKASLTQSKDALETAGETKTNRELESKERGNELEQALTTNNFANPNEARQASLNETEIERLEQSGLEHAKKTGELQARITNLLENQRGRTIEADQLENLEQHVRELERQIRDGNANQGRLEQQRREISTRKKRANELQRDKGKLDKQYDTYAALTLELRSDNFQEYMLAQLQHDLLARASTMMREITRERFTLQLIDGEYAVLDNWNALEPRSVRTLSGGESFIASLSLALALSDELAGSKALGALFLDEGFGTLDSEALDAVAGVLETIQTQGRMVGIITHVQALAERLPNRLIVEKGPVSSRVRWETDG